MNKYFLLLLVLTPYLGFAGKEADTSNFIQMGVARRARQHIAPLAPLMVGLNMNLAQYNYQNNIPAAVNFEYNYRQARNGATPELNYSF
jgi:hypothetical protein